MSLLEYHIERRALIGPVSECGDTGLAIEDGAACFFALVDVLGHGREAAQVARLAEGFLRQHAREPLPLLMELLHERLRGTRGCVAALGRLNAETGALALVGIGNICVRIEGPEPARVILGDGVIGYTMSTPREKAVRLHRGDLLLLYSDGIKEFFDLRECPGLLGQGIDEVAATILRRFGKASDDASCLALRYAR